MLNLATSNILFPAVIGILFIMFFYYQVIVTAEETVRIGAIVNDDTRIGREIKASMIVAAESFNDSSANLKISLEFRNPGGNPLQAAYAAEELVKNKDAKVIIGMETWAETLLVAGVGSRASVPVVSLATSATPGPSMPDSSPFLIQMATNITEQIRCITSIVQKFGWLKVIPIYESDTYGGDSGLFSALSEALQNIGVEIEYRVVLPPFSSLSDPQAFVSDLLANILSKQSRVFIVHVSSLPYVDHLFTNAMRLRLIEKDSAWIIMEPVPSLLDSFSSSVNEKMDGSLGIRTYIPQENSLSFIAFELAFEEIIKSRYGNKESSKPGLYALRAYDGITAIANAIQRINNGSSISSTMLAKAILSSNFTGLSGHVSFQDGKLAHNSIFQIINLIGTGYKKIGFWSSEHGGLSRNLSKDETCIKNISWPGDLTLTPKGWSMPSDAKPLKIGIPGKTSFAKFVKVPQNQSADSKDYSGFCIDVFFEVLQIVEHKYPLPHTFEPFNGTYDELVQSVANKTFDAVIGDVTILANRSKSVEFTLPFAESGLVMVVGLKSHEENKASIFLKPFTWKMWIAIVVLLIYTISIVWLLERQSNPEFEGPWWHQISTAFWFTCSSIFFAQRETIRSNYTRVVVVAWLFVVLVLTSSYTANLSSILIVPRFDPNVTDIQFLKAKNATIGCDGDSFVRKYLQDVIGFGHEYIKSISSEYDYPDEFKSGNITAAFLELPYGKAYLNHYCEGYTFAGNNTNRGGDRFGGLGFVFQKGSPIAADFSQAILTLTENERLKQLEIKYFSPSPQCSKTTQNFKSLNWSSFLGLYLFSIVASTLCYLAFIIPQVYEQWIKKKEPSTATVEITEI